MEKVIKSLEKFVSRESRIVSTVITQGTDKILYTSENWDISDDLDQINEHWDSIRLGDLSISGEEYKIIQITVDKLVAINLEKKGTIIGFKDEVRRIICKIETGETGYLGLAEASRTLGDLKQKKPYLAQNVELGKSREVKWSTPKVLLDETQNLKRLGLLKVGLTLEEAKVYLALLQKGDKGEKVGNLNKQLEIKRTTIYRIIDRLVNKNWVYKLMETPTGTTIYIAKPLNEFIDNIIQEKEDELKILKSFRCIMGESTKNGWINISKEKNMINFVGLEKDCGLIIFEYDEVIKNEVIIKAALQLSYERLKKHLQPDPNKDLYINPDIKEIKITHTEIYQYLAANMYIKFKDGTKSANNIGTDRVLLTKHVAIPIEDKIYVIWGTEEKFPILMSVILKIK